MADLEIELGDSLVKGVKQLAVRHYGDNGDASIGHVAEAALEMRLLWEDLVKGGENEVEEPTVNWEFDNTQSAEQVPDGIRDWLFRRR